MDGQTMIPISAGKLRVSQTDTLECQNANFFFQRISLQCPNPSPWTVGCRDRCMKWQQYPSASMSAEGKSSSYTSMSNLCHSFQVICHQMHRNLKMWWMNGLVERQLDRWLMAGGYFYVPSTWYKAKLWFKWISKLLKKNCDLDLSPTTLKS